MAELDLRFTNVQGPLPASLFQLTNLTALYLGNSNIGQNGQIPEEIGNLSQLVYLKMMNASWGGTVPKSLSRLQNLRYLVLAQNSLSGTVDPSIAALSSIATVDLSSNMLTGQIPLALFFQPSITTFYFSLNNLTGCIERPVSVISGGNCDAILNPLLCACSVRECGVPPCNVSCLERKPANQAICLNGNWVVVGSSVSSNTTNTFNGSVLIAGNLIIPSNQSLTVIGVQQGTVVSVEGCVTFNGQLSVNLASNLTTVNSSTPLTLVTFSSYCNDTRTQFQTFSVENECGRLTDAQLRYGPTDLSIVFGASDPRAGCAAAPSGLAIDAGLSPQTIGIIVGCVLGGVLIIVIILVVLIKTVPAVSRALTPWKKIRETTNHQEELDGN